MTFTHVFTRRLRCTVEVADKPPTYGSPVFDINWTERPRKKDLKEYRRWILGVNQHLAGVWNLKIAYAIEVRLNVWELWMCNPGEAPVLAELLGNKTIQAGGSNGWN